jgi:hypothetical protein
MKERGIKQNRERERAERGRREGLRGKMILSFVLTHI